MRIFFSIHRTKHFRVALGCAPGRGGAQSCSAEVSAGVSVPDGNANPVPGKFHVFLIPCVLHVSQLFSAGFHFKACVAEWEFAPCFLFSSFSQLCLHSRRERKSCVLQENTYILSFSQMSDDGHLTIDSDGAEYIFGLLAVLLECQGAIVRQLTNTGSPNPDPIQLDANHVSNPLCSVSKRATIKCICFPSSLIKNAYFRKQPEDMNQWIFTHRENVPAEAYQRGDENRCYRDFNSIFCFGMPKTVWFG